MVTERFFLIDLNLPTESKETLSESAQGVFYAGRMRENS